MPVVCGFLNPAYFVVGGLVNGAVYGLTAMGIVFTYKLSRVVNFAYGAIALLCAYSYWQARVKWEWPAPVAFVFAVILVPSVLALLSERFVYRRLAHASVFAKTAASIGILLAALGVTMYVWHDRIVHKDLQAPSIYPNRIYRFGLVRLNGVPLAINGTQLGIVITTVALVAVTFLLLRFTSTGLALRAVVANRSLAELRGVDALRMTKLAWVLGYVIAALAGVMLASVAASEPILLTIIVLYSLSAAALGGLVSLPWAVAGGFVIGLTDALLLGYLPSSSFWPSLRSTVPFVFLLVALVVGGRRNSAQAEPGQRAALLADLYGHGGVRPKANVMAVVPRASLVIVAAVLLRATGNGYAVAVLSTGAVLGIIFVGARVFAASTGLVSLMMAALAGIGAMSAAYFRTEWGWPWLLALLAGAAVSAIAGALVALPTVRLRGIYLALATLAASQLIEKVVYTRNSFTGGLGGRALLRPDLVRTDTAYLILLVVFFVVIGYLCERFQFCGVGRELQADLGSSAGARSIGIRPEKGRLLAFALSSGVIGFGGGLLGTQVQHVTPEAYGFVPTFLWLTLVASGGLGSTVMMLQMGVLTGAVAEIVSVHFPRFESGYVALFGVLGLMLLRIPGGAAALEARIAARVRPHRRDTEIPSTSDGDHLGEARCLAVVPE